MRACSIPYRGAGLSSFCCGLCNDAITMKPTKASTSSRTSSHGGIGDPGTTHERPRQRLVDADGVFGALASPTQIKRCTDGIVPSRSVFLQISLQKI
jgi:hypothetical protein